MKPVTVHVAADENVEAGIIHSPVVDERRLNRNLLRSFTLYLADTGKICPRPWYWARFYHLYRPHYESYWLMMWWQTSDEEKNIRFLEQLEYLAKHTMRFKQAYRYLIGIDEKDWYIKRKS